jgi:proteasome lid subunit RPN8/RPN11
MQADIDSHLPEEACGLLAGRFRRAEAVIPVSNALHSPVRFRMDARQQLDAFLWMDARELDLVAIYHSHPNGPDTPSETDIGEAYYPDAAYLIWSRRTGDWVCRAYRLHPDGYDEIVLSVE